MPSEQQIRDAWAEHRPYLVDMAFRMLGDIGRAEDVVQEAFHRLSQSDFDAIEDARGWLIVVTSRLCLDVIRSARNRRERPVGAAGAGGAVRADGRDRPGRPGRPRHPRRRRPPGSAGRARAALPGGARGLRPPRHLRRAVRHGRRRRSGDPRRPAASWPAAPGSSSMRPTAPAVPLSRRHEHRVVTDRFIAACANGNFDELLAVLDPDVTGGVDLRPGLVVHGAEPVAHNLVHFWGWGASLVSLPFVDKPWIVAFAGPRRRGAVLLDGHRRPRVQDPRVRGTTRAGVHPGPHPPGRLNGLARHAFVVACCHIRRRCVVP